jgi:hypothetical protein
MSEVDIVSFKTDRKQHLLKKPACLTAKGGRQPCFFASWHHIDYHQRSLLISLTGKRARPAAGAITSDALANQALQQIERSAKHHFGRYRPDGPFIDLASRVAADPALPKPHLA